MSPDAFYPSSFLADFITALGRYGRVRPVYPECAWHRCLEHACELDNARMLAARYARLDAVKASGPREVLHERLYGSTAARMNGEVLHLVVSDEPEFPRKFAGAKT